MKTLSNKSALMAVFFWCLLPASGQAFLANPASTFDIRSISIDTRSPLLTEVNRSISIVTFIDLPDQGTIKVTTEAGVEIMTFPIRNGQKAKSWPLLDTFGEQLAEGVYVYQIEGGNKTIVGELVIVEK